MIKGILFDFDGTIVDSEKSRKNSLNEVLLEFNLCISEERWKNEFLRIRSLEILNILKCENNLDFDIYQLYEISRDIRKKIIEKSGPDLIEGFKEFHDFLKEKNIPFAICSGGRRETIEIISKKILLPEMTFFTIEDFVFPKPHPNSFLMGLKHLNLSANEVLVFEDSVTGIQAALNAKIEKIIVLNTSGEEEINNFNFLKKINSYKELDFKEFF